MKEPAQGILRLFAVIIGFAQLPVAESLAQSYPVKPIRMLVGFAAGGGTDITARMVARKLADYLGQLVVIENRPGAGGSLATERAAASPADGYTLLMIPASEAAQPALRAKLPYDLDRDLAPVSMAANGTFLLVVHPSVPARNTSELIALARSRPGKLNYGSSGIGGTSHFAAELFNLMAKVNIVHIAYRGGAETVVAVATGQIDITYPSVPTALPLLEAGKLKALAVTRARRSPLMPSVPTLSESGLPGYNRFAWYGVLVPMGVPKNVIARLNEVIGKAMTSAEMTSLLTKQGMEPQTNTPEEFAAFIRVEIAQNVRLAKLTGIKVE